MKNLLFLFFLGLSLHSFHLKAQNCTFPGAYTCSSADILCGLGQLYGMFCSTPQEGNNATGPSPTLCNGNGTSANTIWWAFYGNGEMVSLNIQLDECTKQGQSCTGIRAGIIEGCNGGQVIDCTSNCANQYSELELWGYLEAGKIYYLWVDGCCGDICSFHMYTNAANNGLPNPLPDLKVKGEQCIGAFVDICINNAPTPQNNSGLSWTWTVDGTHRSEFDNLECLKDLELTNEPFEICVNWSQTASGASNPCATDSKCLYLKGYASPPIKLPAKSVCYDEHQFEYHWSPGAKDTVIRSSCIDPPCTIVDYNQNHCRSIYTQSITLLPERKTGRKFLFSCDTAAFIAEDGSRLDTSVCDFPITWQTPQGASGQLCDSTYYLNLELFRPEVALSIDTLQGHNSEFVLASHKAYSLTCLPGTIQLKGFWMTPDAQRVQGDTLHLHPSEDSTGLYQYFIHVEYADTLHPASNASCDYITQQSFYLESCTLAFPETENLLCITKNQLQFDLDFSWLGMTGDSFTLSSANQMLGTYAFSDLPVTIRDFTIGDTDSTYQFKICGTGPASCCLDYSVFIPECKGTATSGVHILSNRIRYSGSTKTLHISVPSGNHINLDIYRVPGIKIRNLSLCSGQNSIEMQDAGPGIYIAVLSNENGQMVDVFRFVVL